MLEAIEKDGISFSIRNGMYLPFLYKGRQIVVHQATWTFRERIWVDDELVVNEIGMRMASRHVIDVEGDDLAVTFGYRDGMRTVFVEAKVDDEVVHQFAHEMAQQIKLSSVVIAVILGALLGTAAGYLIGSLFGGS